MTLILVSRHSTGASAALTEMPSSTRPRRVVALVSKRSASASDVFPAPPCPKSPTLRMRSAGYWRKFTVLLLQVVFDLALIERLSLGASRRPAGYDALQGRHPDRNVPG